VVAPELYPQGGRSRSHETHGSVGAHLGKEARFGAEEHVAVPKLTLTRRRGSGPRDTL
jgi:hypothetical protein